LSTPKILRDLDGYDLAPGAHLALHRQGSDHNDLAVLDLFDSSPQLQRPLDYFLQMLEGIEELDGFALHTYTHGPDVDLITTLKKFTDDPIKDHYYDFQAYRPFVEAIPPKWRDRPVYITETNHWTKKDGSLGWENRNIGWVRAAYEEIHRWNSTPHTRQIHCLLLYRWQGDEWAIDIKDQVQVDFKMALSKDYRWRR